MNMQRSEYGLDQLQRWMQSVIVHPGGVVPGMESTETRQHIDVTPERVEEVINRSRNLTSLERLQVYANAYYARLLECLREEFPALVHALGEQTFDGFAFGYLQAYPSRSYNLTKLGHRFPQFLAETRPGDATGQDNRPSWPDFLVELASLERTYNEVFDGPGCEGTRILQTEDITAIAPGDWPGVRLIPVPCLRLVTLRYPVHQYISAVRQGVQATIPQPSLTHLVISRREFIVRRCAVSASEYRLLSALIAGETVGEAIEHVASQPGIDLELLEGDLQRWFCRWAAAAFFERVELT